MITIKVHLDSQERYRGFSISGHADSNREKDGYDLVCAAVSGVTLTCALGLQDVLQIEGRYDSKYGFMNVDIGNRADNLSDILIKTMLCGLEEIRKRYPDTLNLKMIKG